MRETVSQGAICTLPSNGKSSKAHLTSHSMFQCARKHRILDLAMSRPIWTAAPAQDATRVEKGKKSLTRRNKHEIWNVYSILHADDGPHGQQ